MGILTAAIGAGALLGSLAASLLVGSRRLGAWFAVGVALWGLPVTLIGVFPRQVAALGLLACVGVGNSLIDLAGFTLLARLAADEVLGRVFGVLESLVALSIGVGAIVASMVVDWAGVRPALVTIGLLCPVLAVAAWQRLRGMDRSIGVRDHDIDHVAHGAHVERPAAARRRAARSWPGIGRRARWSGRLPPRRRRRPLLPDRVGRGRCDRGRAGRGNARSGAGFRRDRPAPAGPPDRHRASHQRAPAEGVALRPLPPGRARLHAECPRGRAGGGLDARPLRAP